MLAAELLFLVHIYLEILKMRFSLLFSLSVDQVKWSEVMPITPAISRAISISIRTTRDS